METFNDSWAKRLNEALSGRWHVWYVLMTGRRSTCWCARPEGTDTATVTEWSADDLARKITAVDPASGPLVADLIPEIEGQLARWT